VKTLKASTRTLPSDRSRLSLTIGFLRSRGKGAVSVPLVSDANAAASSDVNTAAPITPQVPDLKSIIGHLALSLLTAIVIPGLLFYVCLVSMSVWAALVAALAWCYGAVAWRMATRRRASGLLALTVAVMTVRTGIALASGDTFVYFLQPVLSNVVLAGAFFVSLASARPVVARLAADFYPMTSEIAKRPSVQRLFWRLTLLWAFVCLCRAGITFWLLESQSVVNFVMLRSLSLLALTVVAVAVTVVAAVSVARREELLLPAKTEA
jgi:hypothetical protein